MISTVLISDSEVSSYDSLLSIFLKHLFSHWNQNNCIEVHIIQNKTLHFQIIKYWKWGGNWTCLAPYLAILIEAAPIMTFGNCTSISWKKTLPILRYWFLHVTLSSKDFINSLIPTRDNKHTSHLGLKTKTNQQKNLITLPQRQFLWARNRAVTKPQVLPMFAL